MREKPDVYQPDLAISLNNIGLTLRSMNRLETSLQSLRAAIEIRQHLSASRPDVFKPLLATSLLNCLRDEHPVDNKDIAFRLFPERAARPEPRNDQPELLAAGIFLGLVLVVLLVACINVANLLLVRATRRRGELAIRAAMGAGRARLVRQLLTESALLAVFGGLAGIAVGATTSWLIGRIQVPGSIRLSLDYGHDGRVLAYTFTLALASGLIVGLMPALRAARASSSGALRQNARTVVGHRRHRLRDALVVAQVAGSVVVLIVAGLFVRSLSATRGMDLGFEHQRVLNASFDPTLQGYDEEASRRFFERLLPTVRDLAGVESASLAYSTPVGYYSLATEVSPAGAESSPDERWPTARYNLVSPAYFRTLGIPLMAGRGFLDTDNAEGLPVAIVNETMAQRLWPARDPLGQRFSLPGEASVSLEVVGIAADGIYQWLLEDPVSHFYRPLAQDARPLRVLQVRAAGAPSALAEAVRTAARRVDATVPIFDVMTMSRSLDSANGFFLSQWGAKLASVLGALGLLLAVIGVYGVVSFAASTRTQEIGVRMAMGAGKAAILRTVMLQGLHLVALGLVIGLLATVGLTRVLTSLLYGVSPSDPATYGAVAVLLAGVAFAACYLPARRASGINPTVALRAG